VASSPPLPMSLASPDIASPSGASASSSDPAAAAEAFHVSALLNCALREADDVRWTPTDDGWQAALPVLDGTAWLETAVAYRSPTGRHRYAGPLRLRTGDHRRTVDLALAASLVVDALSADRATPAARLALLERIAQSCEATTEFLADGGAAQREPYPAGPQGFLDSERSLVLGHPFHPTPKSRGPMRPDERRRYAPETGVRFALRWLAVDDELVRSDSAVLAADGVAERSAADVAGDLLPVDVRDALRADHPGRTLVPVHPWELDWLRGRDDVAGLLRSGAIADLGEHGPGFQATTSVRTVAHETLPWQLKFSLHLKVTNSMRVTLPRELDRAVEAARLARTAVGERMAAVAPRWRVVHDPAYLAVRHDGRLIDGLSVLLRENRWTDAAGYDAAAVTALCQEHPYDGRSRLARIVDRLAAETGEDPAIVARRWFASYCEALVVSVLRIYLDVGLTFEPHAQNVVLELEDGWPVRAVHRDSQGYFHREAAHADLTAIVPGLGEVTESIFPEALADQRLVYYPFVNNALGVVGAFGMAGLVDERILLADLRAVIEREREIGGRYPATLLDRLLDDERWPCKANLRTRIDDLDELVGDIADQSVYGSIANPLRTGADAA
ncbi:MAG: IucA/IucC family protein, partial [Patulibacter sp.]